MARSLSTLFKEIARQASELDEPFLAQLCRMAALEAARPGVILEWEWDVADDDLPSDRVSNVASIFSESAKRSAKPYLVWSRSASGNHSVLAPSAKAALAAVTELSDKGQSDIVVKDMDGNHVELEVLQFRVDLESNPSIRLVPR